jgi:RNA polymerase sigma-70 factor (ECF subfamily)
VCNLAQKPLNVNDEPIQNHQTESLNQLLTDIGAKQSAEAFAAIYSHFGGRVKSFLIGKGINEDTAEELMQEVMISVWRRACTYDRKKAAASTWIFTIARNRRIDYLRGTPRIELELEDELMQLESDDDPHEQQVDLWQDTERVQSAMALLPKEQYKALHLSFFKGQSHGAIAARLDLPIGTVKSRIRLAMRSIRNALQQHEETT